MNEPQTEKKCATADQHGTGNPVPVEVDSRIYMAAERTFLAWIRTGIALMGFGFVVARFGLFLRELTLAGTHQQMTSTGFSLPIGIGLIGFGIVVNFVSVIRHRRYIAAKRGHLVTGIDFLEEPINIAKQKAVERGLTANFRVMDALKLAELPDRFDTVIDSGLFHVFSDEDRQSYVDGLSLVLKPGGRFYLLCFSDEEPGTIGPRRVSEKEIRETFAKGWHIQSIERSRYEVRPDPNDPSFKDGGPKAWFVVVGRVTS